MNRLCRGQGGASAGKVSRLTLYTTAPSFLGMREGRNFVEKPSKALAVARDVSGAVWSVEYEGGDAKDIHGSFVRGDIRKIARLIEADGKSPSGSDETSPSA
jgi:hypothetical protein